jgi:hypothetical protein
MQSLHVASLEDLDDRRAAMMGESTLVAAESL